MQTGNWNECPFRPPLHHRFDRYQGGADHRARGFIDTLPRRRIAGVQVSVTRGGALIDEVEIGRGMKTFQLFSSCLPRSGTLHTAIQAGLVQLAHERFVPIGPEWMTFAKSIA